MTDGSPPAEELGTGARMDIFALLLTADSPHTPSDISNEIGTTRQQVQYHLDILVRMGLVLPADATADDDSDPPEGSYVPQPALTSEQVNEEVEAALMSLVPTLREKVVLPEEVEDGDTVINNCIKMAVASRLK